MRNASGSLDDRPPPLGSWPRLYAAVIVGAAAWITLLWWMTTTFADAGSPQ